MFHDQLTLQLGTLKVTMDEKMGWGLVAAKSIPKGTVVHSFAKAVPVLNKTRHSLQISSTENVVERTLAMLNHSCEPNIWVEVDARQCIALHDIPEGATLSFFYPATEWDMAMPFDCQCGSERCLGMIRGAKYLASDLLKNFKLSPHILALLATHASPS